MQHNDVARAADAPGKILLARPLDMRADDSAWTNPPSGGYMETGGLDPQKRPNGLEAVPDVASVPSVIRAAGTLADGALIDLGDGNYNTGDVVRISYTVDNSPAGAQQLDSALLSDGDAGQAVLAIGVLILFTAHLASAVVEDNIMEIFPAGTNTTINITNVELNP